MSNIRVHFSTIHSNWPYKRQTPQQSLIWDTVSFFINDEKEEADFLVVYDEPHTNFTTTLPKHRRILFITEPPSIKEYKKEYLQQFGVIFTPQKIENLSEDIKQIISQTALPWYYGVLHSNRLKNYKTYDELKSMPVPKKKNAVSAIVSSKTMNRHHIQRLKAVKFLKSKLGNKFHLFGKGHQNVDDKAEGIESFAFHLVCENNGIPNFWTEKMADAYLGWSFPLFSGCANIGRYFPKESFISVNLDNPAETARLIESLLSEPSFFKERLPALEKARKKVLDEYNMFALIAKNVNNSDSLKSNNQNIEPEMIEAQTKKKPMLERAFAKARRVLDKGTHRAKNIPFLLPLYFKLINCNLFFFTDYYDSLGDKALNEGYFGQRGQDWFLDKKVFDGKEKGFFLDVGANDPKDLSNTYFFEKKGWQGLAFEPQERFRKKWKDERKTKCLPHLLGEKDGEEVRFVEYDTDDWQNALSGVEGYAVEEANTLKDISKKYTIYSKKRLATVLEEHNIIDVDFMSVDVEGFEMQVLKGIDFDKVNINVIIVENDRSHLGDTSLRRFIKQKGYRHIARLSGDDVFQKD